MPVVENLEDLWLVSKLQRERKAKEQAAKQQRLVQLQVCCAVCMPPFGPLMDVLFCLQ